MDLSIWKGEKKRSPIFFLSLTACLTSATFAKTSIQQYFQQIPDYRFEVLTQISSTRGHPQIGFLHSSIIDEYILISYSSWRVRSRDSAAPLLTLEIYEMKDALGAFGMFSIWDEHRPEPPRRLDLPVDNEYREASLSFWRGNYFMHLSAPDGEAFRPEQFASVARTLVEAIPLLNLHPLTVLHLPKEGLIRESIRFYLGKSSFALDHHFPKQMASQIGFEDQIEVTAACYQPSGHTLYLVAYPTITLAARYFARLQNAMESYFSPQGVYMKRSGVIIPIFFGPEPEAQEILARVSYVPSIRWIYRKDQDPALAEAAARDEVLSFLGILGRSLLFTLVFALFTIGGGVTAGLIRYQVLRRFPGITRRDETIRLRLSDR